MQSCLQYLKKEIRIPLDQIGLGHQKSKVTKHLWKVVFGNQNNTEARLPSLKGWWAAFFLSIFRSFLVIDGSDIDPRGPKLAETKRDDLVLTLK